MFVIPEYIRKHPVLKTKKCVVGSLLETKMEMKKKRHYSGFNKFPAQPPDSTFYYLTFLP